MEAGPAATGRWIRRRLPPTALVCLVFLALQSGFAPPPLDQWVSELVQLALATTAAGFAFRAAQRDRALSRSFWALVGFGMALWAVGQGLWIHTTLVAPSRVLVVVRDLGFVAFTAPLIAACVLRPHRPRPGALGLAADVGLLSVVALFLYAYFPVSALAAGHPDEGRASLLYNPQRLLLLAVLLWLLRGTEGRWRRAYEELGLALAVFHGGGVVSNGAILTRTYRPGLYDLPWALPFLWIALAAADWRPRPVEAGEEGEGDAVAWEARDWREARHGSLIGLTAAVKVPTVHLLARLAGSPSPEVARLRGHIALAGTLLVGSLYLARQLGTLRRAEGMQRMREEHLRALVENSADAIGVLDQGCRLKYLSASAERVTGHRPEELVGTRPLEIVHPDERESIRRAFEGVATRPGATARGFVRYRHRDGGFRHGAIDAANCLGDLAVGGVVLHLRDVTESVRAAEERERSLSLLEATLESTADGLVAVGREGRIERFNQKFAAMWWIPDEALASGQDVRRFVTDQLEDPAAFLPPVEEVHGPPEAESVDSLRSRDGRVFERYSQPRRLGGEVVGRVWSFRDVSARARAEGAMARLVAIIEATPDFVGTFDGALGLLYLNRAGRRMVGLADDEPLDGRTIVDLYPKGAASRALEEAMPIALREGSWSGESALRHREGRDIPVLQVVLAHRSPGGEVDFLSTIARDISGRKREEEELRRSQTMAALGGLVAGVAHEVRNPLFGISSTLDAFEARYSGQQDHRRYVRVLREQLGRLNALMTDLLEYGKPAALALAEAPLEAVLAQALLACVPMAERAGVALESGIDGGLPPLRVDGKRLSQVFCNLIENAVQHSPAGGTVRVAAGLVRDEGRSWVECVVEDSGPGFRAPDLPHVFEPFFTKRKGGTGLGLSIVERIVTDHGGTLAAGNRPEGGARLRVRLPAAPAPEKTA